MVMGVDPNAAADGMSNMVIFIVVGLAVLWLLSVASEQVFQKLKPVLMFLIIACAVGAVAIRALANIF